MDRNMLRIAGAIVALLGMAVPSALHAVATTGAPGLEFAWSVRSTAMASSGVADMSDPANVYSNPAAATAIEGVWATGLRAYLAPGLADDLWFGDVNTGVCRGFGADNAIRVGLSMTFARFSYGESIATQPDGTPLGTWESWEDIFGLAAGVAGGVGESLRWSFGAGLKRWSAEYGPEEFTIENNPWEGSGWMVDLGATAWLPLDASEWRVTPALGVAVVNAGSDVEFGGGNKDPLPSWFNYGVSIRVDGPEVVLGSNHLRAISVTANMDGQHGMNEQRPRWRFGYELALMEAVFVRAGRQADDRLRQTVYTWGIGVGAPIGPVRARLEYTRIDGSYYYIPRDTYGLSLAWLFEGAR